MKCYQHRAIDSVGICRSCGKAMCGDCATDLGFAITCRGKCGETEVAKDKLNKNAIAVYSAQKKNRYLAPLFFIILGVVYAGYGFSCDHSLDFSVVAGICFSVFGTMLFIAQQRLMKKINT